MGVAVKKKDPLGPKERVILSLMGPTPKEWITGLRLVEWSKSLPRGSHLDSCMIYMLLLRLEKRGFIRSRYLHDEGLAGGRRKEYQITDSGSDVLREV